MKFRAQRALRVSCVVYLVLAVMTHLIAGSEGAALPAALQIWQTANPLPTFYSVGGSLALAGSLVGTAGLLMQKGWAAYVHLASTVLWIAFGCSAGPVVSAGLSAPLVTAMFLVAGFIYGLVFFTEALERSQD